MAALRGSVILSLVLSLSLCCAAYRLNNEETDEEYLRRELNNPEHDLKVKNLFDELKELFNSNEITTKFLSRKAPPTTEPSATTEPPAPPTTEPPENTPKSKSINAYIQHIVNCYKSYRFVTERGLSERDDIYNIITVQCMLDPRVERLVKLLTAYYYYKLNEGSPEFDAYDAVEWLFSTFVDEDNVSGEENKSEETSKEDDKTSEEDHKTSNEDDETSNEDDETFNETSAEDKDETTSAPNPTTLAAKEPTTKQPEPTTIKQQQTTVTVKKTTAAIKKTTDKVLEPTVHFSNNIGVIAEDNDKEAVRELLLQRVLMKLSKLKQSTLLK